MKPCTHTTTPHLGGGLYRLSDTSLSVPMRGCRNFRPRKFQSVFTFNTL